MNKVLENVIENIDLVRDLNDKGCINNSFGYR